MQRARDDGADRDARAPDARDALTRAHRDEWPRVVATLAKRFANLDLAEESAAEAFAAAAERWPAEGIPPNPGGWLTTTATRKAIDSIRRESTRDARYREALLVNDTQPEPLGAIDDDRLRLIFVCCHPALAMNARVALTLRMVGGLSVPEIASAFLVHDTTMGARLTRAKAKIAAAGIPFRLPDADDVPRRVSGVLAVLFLIFNEGYLASNADSAPVRDDLTGEAIRLARLVRQLLPLDGEVSGMLALLLLIDARRAARVSPSGELVPLAEQDRRLWNTVQIAEGHALVRERLASGQAPGRYQLLAAINAVHTDGDATDWAQVVALYDQLLTLDPSPIVRLNRAIAVGESGDLEAGLALIDDLEPDLSEYHAFHAARAHVLSRLGRSAASRDAYDAAIGLAGNAAEVAFLTRRRDEGAVDAENVKRT
ncbi:RNA polymerase sigma factor [Subtercola sp. YIM 133946]|uniref:RNA polymerase sigma factor n=1 Tax=Subtercola sp. YIM 133946 TaxID=3118909 RepID=UPI002F95F928